MKRGAALVANRLSYSLRTLVIRSQAGGFLPHRRLAPRHPWLGLVAISLAACQSAPEPRVETVEVKVPVAVQPITKDQIPALPRPLGPRPGNASDAADVALAGRCEAIAFVIRAWPLLQLSAGLPPVQAPDYPECRK